MWDGFVSLLVSLISFLTGFLGHNIGLSILVSTLLVRFALLPLSVKIAYATLRRQKDVSRIQPELDAIKKRYKDDPQQMSKKTLALYKENGISMMDGKSLLIGIIQIPVFLAMFRAIQSVISSGNGFLWIHNIASPDIILTVIAAGLTYIATSLGPSLTEQTKTMMVWLPVLLTLFFLWKLSAGIGVYWVGSNIVSIVQSAILRNKAKALQ